MKSFEHEGVFWLPDNVTQIVAGRLTYDPDDGPQLSLIGSFGTPAESLSSGEIHRDIILGVANKRELTLVNCDRQGFTLESPGIQRERYRSEAILTGHHFTSLRDLMFDQVHVTIGGMEHWIGKSSVRYSVTINESKNELVETSATLRPLPTEVTIGEDEDVALHFDYSFGGDALNEFRLRNGCHFRISTATPRGLQPIVRDAGLLQHLLTLSAGRALPLEEVKLTSADIERPAGGGRFQHKTIEYYAALPSTWIKMDKPVQNYEMLVTYTQMGGIRTICKWLSVARRFDRVLNFLLSVRYARQIFAENRLQNTIGAAETFHRMRFNNYVMPPQDYKTYRRKLVKAVPAADRNWLSQQLTYSNEPRLRNRLAELAAYAGQPFSELAGGDVDGWVAVVTKVRNRLTHYDEEGEVDVPGGDLYFLSESLLLLVMLCLFVECDVAPDTLRGILQNQRVMFLQERLLEVIPRLRDAFGP